MFNPYAQSGWANAANPNAGSSGTVPQPSIFGALPYASPRNPPPTFVPFRITSSSPSPTTTSSSSSSSNTTPEILDSTVTGPPHHSRTYFRVRTDAPTVGFTVIHNSATKEPVGVIEWRKHPVIEIRNILPKQPTGKWLELSADRTYRTMTARGKTFVWAPDGNYICLYAPGLNAPETYARVSREESGSILLELTPEAIQLGLLEVAVAAALLLQCGRKVD
ncbi:hypothetical protein R3P38DRAFT_2497574 [Favolaschia claudopus]|uniref:DUF6593 domain-containing protein n=1 Tax=Favolaschia claudopus TaxID=2862362 RepID=A0AAW0DZ27_9AGAR